MDIKLLERMISDWDYASATEERDKLREVLEQLAWRVHQLMDRLPTATFPASSAPTTGPATKPSVSSSAMSAVLTASPAAMLAHIHQVIMAFSRSTLFTPIELTTYSPDSSTLQLTLRWPTPSIETQEDGSLGSASHDPVQGENDGE